MNKDDELVGQLGGLQNLLDHFPGGVVIVDTPGTGSVFRKHERIAKNFLSRSDLVIFLLSAKRALAETGQNGLASIEALGEHLRRSVHFIHLPTPLAGFRHNVLKVESRPVSKPAMALRFCRPSMPALRRRFGRRS